MSALAPLRHPGYPAFLAGRVTATLGVQMLYVAVGWQIYALTGNALDLGLVGLVLWVPQAALFPVVGIVVDRARRDRVLQATYFGLALAAALLAALSATGQASREAIYGALFLLALARIFSSPAAQALLPQLVPREDFPRAVSLNSATFEGAVITGPALGGLLYGFADGRGANGAAVTHTVAAVLIALAFAMSLFLPARRAEHAGAPPGLRQALDGVRFIFRRKILLSAITLDLFAVLFGGAIALLPVYAKDILQVGPEGLGMLRAAPALGSLSTALFLAQRPVKRGVGRKLYVAIAVFGLATVVFALSETFWISLLALAITGAADEVSVFIRLNVVQMATPDRVRGRVSAAEFVFIGASNELGQLESGLTAAWWGAVPAAVVGGLGTLLTVAVSALVSKQLRSVDRLEDVEPIDDAT